MQFKQRRQLRNETIKVGLDINFNKYSFCVYIMVAYMWFSCGIEQILSSPHITKCSAGK